MTKVFLTIKEIAAIMGVCKQRIAAKIKDGHFPKARRCDCGHSIIVPKSDVDRDLKRRKGREPS